ncbi:MAG: DUF3021 domain-containing protein [Finegoldia sp.]|nr:DUF3021 domain-containing protein [Finegoldia sp.]
MNKFFEYIKAFVIGVGIGNLIEIFISIVLGELMIGIPEFVNAQSSPLVAKIIESLFYGGFGIVSVLFSDRINGENIFKNSLIHFTILLVYFSVAGLYLKWFTDILNLVISLIFFALTYALIWYIVYRKEKNEVEKINNKLREMNRK